jgi:enoyl-CoA hydratase/carnithine racemase
MPNVQVATADRVTTIRLDRPDKKNALTIEMYKQLTAALAAAQSERDVRAVVLTGTADCFSSGNDIADFASAGQRDGDVTAGLDFVRAIATFEKPIVAAVAGVAIGVGVTMLLHCDLVVAAPSARFKTPFVALGLVPEAASTLLLPALVGERRAAQLLLLGEQIDAATALAWGLVNEVVDDPLAAALAKAKTLAAYAPTALRATKGLLRRVGRDAVLEAIGVEGQAFSAQVRSPEAKEAFQAFLARRPADFSSF